MDLDKMLFTDAVDQLIRTNQDWITGIIINYFS